MKFFKNITTSILLFSISSSLFALSFISKHNKIKENTTSTVIIECPPLTITKFRFPLPRKYVNNITSDQGLRDVLLAKDTGGTDTSDTFHNAFDIACPEKTPVYAAKSGYVSCCYPGRLNGEKWKGRGSYGSMIILNHYDGTKSLYAHLSRTDVCEGAYVEEGQQIALSGGAKGLRASGSSTGPHLHFSVYLDLRTCFKTEEEEQFVTKR